MTKTTLESVDDIFTSLRDRLTGRIEKLTNFTDRSFNYVFTQAISNEVRDLQEYILVAELSNFIDYAGGPVTEDDLERLGYADQITADRVNELMRDEFLDERVRELGIVRDGGARATGVVQFTTQAAATNIAQGTVVSTEADADGTTLEFETVEPASTADGVTQTDDVEIQARQTGQSYNVPAEKILRVKNPPVGVISVENPTATTGGRDRETNAELRARAKEAVGGSSQGGTTEGIKSFIRSTVDPVQEGDIIIDELVDQSPPRVDVIVDGGLDQNVRDAIEASRPAGLRHRLVRPQVVSIGADIDVRGTDIDTSDVASQLETFLLELGISENYFADQVIRTLLQADEDILNIDNLGTFIQEVDNEKFTYQSGTSEYRLEYTYDDVNGSISITDTDEVTYTEGSDFDVVDQSGDGIPETIVWGGGLTPDDGTEFRVDYDVTTPDTIPERRHDTTLVRDESFTFDASVNDSFDFNNSKTTYELSTRPFVGSVTITDENGTTFTQDTDYQLAPLADGASRDTFSYTSGTTDYTLSTPLSIEVAAIVDETGTLYTRGTDYTLIDADGDGLLDTVSWDTTNSFPGDGTSFTVDYNTLVSHIRWDTNQTTPPQDDQFTVSYEQRAYEPRLEITETPGGIIRDFSGDVYNQDVEYVTRDLNQDGETDHIVWETNPTSLQDGEEFFFTYLTEGDILFGQREKASAGDISVNQV